MNFSAQSLALTGRSSLQANVMAMYCLQIANYIVPLITLPYLIRILGAQEYGVLAVAQAGMFFFVFFVDAGFNTRAVRLLSAPGITHHQANVVYAVTQWIKLGCALLALLVLLLLTQLTPWQAHAAIYHASFLMVAGSLLFPTWLFQGLEIMHFTTLCSVGGRLLATLGIFLLVKSPDDLLAATLLQSSATAISGLLSFGAIRRLRFTLRLPVTALTAEMRRAVSDVKGLAPSEFMTSAMNNCGVFVLSFFVTEAVVGIFAAVEKVARAAVSLFQPLLKALFPRIAGLWHAGKDIASSTEARKWSVRIGITALLVALLSGATAPVLLDRLFGSGWSAQAPLLRALSAWLFAAVMSATVGQLWILARGQNRQYSQVLVITGASQCLMYVAGAALYGSGGLVLALLITELLKLTLFIRATAFGAARRNS